MKQMHNFPFTEKSHSRRKQNRAIRAMCSQYGAKSLINALLQYKLWKHPLITYIMQKGPQRVSKESNFTPASARVNLLDKGTIRTDNQSPGTWGILNLNASHRYDAKAYVNQKQTYFMKEQKKRLQYTKIDNSDHASAHYCQVTKLLLVSNNFKTL